MNTFLAMRIIGPDVEFVGVLSRPHGRDTYKTIHKTNKINSQKLLARRSCRPMA